MSNYGYIGELPLMSDHAYAGLPTYPAPWERAGYSPMPGEIPVHLPQDNPYDYLDNDTRPRQGPYRGAAEVDPKVWDKWAKEAFLAEASKARLNSIPNSSAQSNDPVIPEYAQPGLIDERPAYAEPAAPVYDSGDIPAYAQDFNKTLLDTAGLVKLIMSGEAGNGKDRINNLLNKGYSVEQIAAAQAMINKSMKKPKSNKASVQTSAKPRPARRSETITVTERKPKPEVQLALSLLNARQQSLRNALKGLSPAEAVQRGIIPVSALQYY